MKKIAFLIFCSIIGLVNLHQCLNAQLNWCTRIEGSYSALKGAFDGESSLGYPGSDNLAVLMPSLTAGPGFGLAVGAFNWEEKFLFEMKYSLSVYNATFGSESLGKSLFHNISLIRFTWFFPEEWSDSYSDRPIIQFHLTTGFDIGMLKVKDAYYEDTELEPTNASYTIIGLPVEPGININFSEMSSVNLNVGYRLATTTTVKESNTIDPGPGIGDSLGAGGLYCNLSLILPLNFGN